MVRKDCVKTAFMLTRKRLGTYVAFLASRRHNVPSKLKLHNNRLHVDEKLTQSCTQKLFPHFLPSVYAGHDCQALVMHTKVAR